MLEKSQKPSPWMHITKNAQDTPPRYMEKIAQGLFIPNW